MILPAERELRAVLARFAEARVDHDTLATGRTSRALEEALAAADALLRRYGADADAESVRRDKSLAA